jgi:hypothetical protein
MRSVGSFVSAPGASPMVPRASREHGLPDRPSGPVRASGGILRKTTRNLPRVPYHFSQISFCHDSPTIRPTATIRRPAPPPRARIPVPLTSPNAPLRDAAARRPRPTAAARRLRRPARATSPRLAMAVEMGRSPQRSRVAALRPASHLPRRASLRQRPPRRRSPRAESGQVAVAGAAEPTLRRISSRPRRRAATPTSRHACGCSRSTDRCARIADDGSRRA